MPRKRQPAPWLGTREDTADGTYYAFWYNAAKQRVERLSLRTRDAAAAARRFAAFIEGGADIYGLEGLPAAPLTVSRVLDDYWTEHVQHKTIGPDGHEIPAVVDKARAEDAIENLKAYFGDRPVSDLSITESRKYAEARRTGTVAKLDRAGRKRLASNGTIKRELTVLTAALNHAAKMKRLSKNEVPAIEKPKTRRSRTMWLFEDELRKLRGAAEGRCRDFIEIAYYTGARRASVERLTVFQVDLARGVINLSPDDDIETDKRRPIVPIDPALMPTLHRLKAEATRAGTEWLLGHPGPITSAFRWAAKKAGLATLPRRELRRAGNLTPHLLRHSRATHLLQQGRDIYAVANLLGDNPLTVARVYAHACSATMLARLGLDQMEVEE